MKVADDSILPDFTAVRDFLDIQRRFFLSARTIILDHVLIFGEKQFHPTSLELYLKLHNRRDVWWDGATDRDAQADEQFNRGTWYIRQKKAPRRWRIDITAGSRSECIQAGILIRQLDGKGGPSPGPGVALHRIVRGKFGDQPWSPDELSLIRQIHGKRIDGSDGSPLILKQADTPISTTLAKGSRINLPKSDAKNLEGLPIPDAHLRVSLWRKYSGDEAIADDGGTPHT